MDLSIITVTWNSREYIGRQIQSIVQGAKQISYEQIIVDNGSADGTAAYVRQQFPQVTVIDIKENSGFAAANNLAITKAQGNFLLFLNPDMCVLPGTLDTFVQWFATQQTIGIAGPKICNEHGNIEKEALPRRFPRVWEQLLVLLKIPHLFPHVLDQYKMVDMDVDLEQEVDSVRGSCMLMRREVVNQLGWAFDPRFFIWFEDVDVCRSVPSLGLRVVYNPLITCVDYIGQSFTQQKVYWKQKQFITSMIKYFKKWSSWYQWIWIVLVSPVVLMVARIHDCFVSKK